MSDERLYHIQRLQFEDRAAAEALTLAFVRDLFPALEVIHVQLRPLAVSLNSFNGFLTLRDGRRLFFKTHVEPGGVVQEYYNSSLLAEAGYPVIRPLHASTEYGKQFLIYDLIDSPSVFDVARALEHGERDDLGALTEAQHHADADLWRIYERTLAWQTAADAEGAPVHQLFYHRLGGRYQDFYAGQPFELPSLSLDWETLTTRRWVINGVRFEGTLAAAIGEARSRLCPTREGWSVVGHGDAHNGNVFFTPGGLMYFDPAFGGRHHPLLDLTKPLFHNSLATWMYHPAEVAASLDIRLADDGHTLHVTHSYRPSPVRQMFFASKIERVLRPLLPHLEMADWRGFLKAALMCCPLLTLNLRDRTRFPAEIGLLGLCLVAEMGLESDPAQPSAIDQALRAL